MDMKVHIDFRFAHVLKLFSSVQVKTQWTPSTNSTLMDLLNATEESSPCSSTPNAEQSAARQARLDRQCLCDYNCRAMKQLEARQARLERLLISAIIFLYQPWVDT